MRAGEAIGPQGATRAESLDRAARAITRDMEARARYRRALILV